MSPGTQSDESEKVLNVNNVNMLQFEIIDDNGNNIKYSPISFPSSVDSTISHLQQSPSEALQLAMASEVEVDSPWIDISVLANKSIMPSTPLTSSCHAMSTNIPTFIDLPTYSVVDNELMIGNYQGVSDDMSLMDNIFNNGFSGNQEDVSQTNNDLTMKELNDLLETNNFNNSDDSLMDFATDNANKTLKEITADAGICQCETCKCDPMQEGGCVGGCGPQKPCRPKTIASDLKHMLKSETDSKSLIEEIDSMNVDTNSTPNKSSKCNCKSTKDAVDKGCCVVICLKTLETIKNEIKNELKHEITNQLPQNAIISNEQGSNGFNNCLSFDMPGIPWN